MPNLVSSVGRSVHWHGLCRSMKQSVSNLPRFLSRVGVFGNLIEDRLFFGQFEFQVLLFIVSADAQLYCLARLSSIHPSPQDARHVPAVPAHNQRRRLANPPIPQDFPHRPYAP